MIAKHETTHRVEQERGAPIRDGAVQWWSASMISAFDPQQVGGCFRRGWYRYVGGRHEPTTTSQATGTEAHGQAEVYLKTGEKLLGPIALAMSRFLPQPGPGIMVEHPIGALPGGGRMMLEGAPVYGHSDLVNIRGEYVAPDGEVRADPKNTIEISDMKTTSSIAKWAKSGPQLAETVQMITYGEAVAQEFPATEWVRLSHVYGQTQGRAEAEKRTILVRRADIAKRWTKVGEVARQIKQVALAVVAEDVEANLRACGAYRGCPHRAYCKAGNHDSLSQIFGDRMAASLLNKNKEGETMSLLDNLPNESKDAAVAFDLSAEIAALEAREQAVKASAVPAGFVVACEAVEAAGKGFPALAGEAAAAWARVKGFTDYKSGAGYAGSGLLGGLTLREPGQMAQLAAELAPKVAAPAPAPVEAPAPAPAPVAVSATAPTSLLPPDAPVAAPPVPQAAPVEAAPKVKAGPGRPRKAKAGPVTMSITADTVDTAEPATANVPQAAERHTGAGLEVFVDAIPSCAYESLDEYVDGLSDTICKKLQLVDLRCAPDGSPAAFGKWKGILAAMVREQPPAAGCYVIDTRYSEIHQVVADSVRFACDLYVRGVR